MQDMDVIYPCIKNKLVSSISYYNVTHPDGFHILSWNIEITGKLTCLNSLSNIEGSFLEVSARNFTTDVFIFHSRNLH